MLRPIVVCAVLMIAASNLVKMEVAPYKVDCRGVGPMKCLQVRYPDKGPNQPFYNFYSFIKGFNYVEGRGSILLVE
jgi:hypothetical protein